MKIILFGGSGFIGKNVMKKFPKNSIVPISLRADEWKNNFFPETTVVNLKTGHLLPLEIPKTTAEIFNQK